MIKVVMLIVPCIGVIGLIYKLPESVKEGFFRIPVWITSTCFSFILKLFVHGVMGPFAVIVGDLVLYPILSIWKKVRQMKKEYRANRYSLQHKPSSKLVLATTK